MKAVNNFSPKCFSYYEKFVYLHRVTLYCNSQNYWAKFWVSQIVPRFSTAQNDATRYGVVVCHVCGPVVGVGYKTEPAPFLYW